MEPVLLDRSGGGSGGGAVFGGVFVAAESAKAGAMIAAGFVHAGASHVVYILPSSR